MKKIKSIVFSIIVLMILCIIFLYAKDGRLNFKDLSGDFKEAVSLKKERIEDRLNYNAVTPEEFVQRLKNKGVVVGDIESFGSDNLGAKESYKINVEGKYIYFYIFDWDSKNPDTQETKKALEDNGRVYVEGKYYEASTNDTAMITKYEGNPKEKIIVEEFEGIVALTYDEMAKKRNDEKLNPSETTVDKILDNFEDATK